MLCVRGERYFEGQKKRRYVYSSDTIFSARLCAAIAVSLLYFLSLPFLSLSPFPFLPHSIGSLLNFKIIFERERFSVLPFSCAIALCYSIFCFPPRRAKRRHGVREFLIHLSTSDSYLCPHVTSISVCPMEGPGLGFCPELSINSLKLGAEILLRV